MKNVSELRVPAFCPVCSRPMVGGRQATSMYYKWGTCLDCFIQFIEGREELWKAGRRPTQEDVDKYLSSLWNAEDVPK